MTAEKTAALLCVGLSSAGTAAFLRQSRVTYRFRHKDSSAQWLLELYRVCMGRQLHACARTLQSCTLDMSAKKSGFVNCAIKKPEPLLLHNPCSGCASSHRFVYCGLCFHVS
eukprot:10551446-Lingulodinium_polyedra.AAC.1